MGYMLVVLFYCSGMPLLIMQFFAFLAVYYLVEKMMLSRTYRVTYVDFVPIKLANWTMVVGFFMHLICACSFYSTSDIFPKDYHAVIGFYKGYFGTLYEPKKLDAAEMIFHINGIPFIIILLFSIILFAVITTCLRQTFIAKKLNIASITWNDRKEHVIITYKNAFRKKRLAWETSYKLTAQSKYAIAANLMDHQSHEVSETGNAPEHVFNK